MGVTSHAQFFDDPLALFPDVPHAESYRSAIGSRFALADL